MRRIGIAIARRHRRVRFKNLAISKRIREAADQGDNAPIRFGDRYSVIMRGGRAVLHLLSDYYSDAVLEAAQDEDIEPLGTRGHTTSFPLFLGDLYVGEVNYPPKRKSADRGGDSAQCQQLHRSSGPDSVDPADIEPTEFFHFAQFAVQPPSEENPS